MAQRYGSLTLQLKQLSNLANIGSAYTNVLTSATGKQVMSASGSGSFSFKRNAALMSALASNDGQVAYVYVTDQVAGGAAMDVASFIIDKRKITTSNNGADITVSGADILDQLTFTNAGDGAIDNGSGGASSTDIDDIMAFAAAGWSYTTTGTGSGTRSSTGSYHATRGDNVLQLLIATANRSGDIFRQASYSAPTKAIDWRATPDSSGVTLRMPASPTDYDGSTTTGIIISLSEEIDVAERITGIRPYGAGVGDGRLDITGISSANTGGDPSGYTTTFASNVIVNTSLETALGYQKRIDKDFSEITANEPTNSTQLTAAAVDLWREAINYLQERDGAKKFYRIRCNVAADLRPGQTVSVIYTEREGGITGGSTVWSINDTFTIHEVTNTVGGDGIRWTDLIVGDTVKKRVTPERLSANVAKAAQGTTRKSDIRTSPGAVSTSLTINTTQPIRIDGTSAGDLSSDRTLSINGLSTVGSANQIPGTNAAGTAWEYKTVSGGTGITIGHAANSITVTNSSPASALTGLPFVTIGNTGSLSAERSLTAGDGLDLTDGGANGSVTFAVDVTDFIDTSFGLTESSNNIRVNLAATSGLSFSTGALQLDDSVAGGGLTIASKVLAVGAGDGIDVAADSIAVDVTDIIGNGLTETSNNIVLGTPGTLTASTSNGVTASSHTHAITTSSAISTATAVIMATDSNGRVHVQGFGVGAAASGTGVLDVSSKIYINETADSFVTTGLVINQGAADDIIFSLKSNDMVGQATNFAEADTYYQIGKYSDVEGGARVWGLGEGNVALNLRAVVDTGTAVKSAAAVGPVLLQAEISDGLGGTETLATGGATRNACVIRDRGNALAIFAVDGDLYLDTVVNSNNWDAHDDIALLHGLRADMMPEGHELRRRFGQFIDGARDVLSRSGVVHYNDDGHHFVATKGVQMLTIDAIRQMYEQLNGRIAAIEQKTIGGIDGIYTGDFAMKQIHLAVFDWADMAQKLLN